MALRSALFLLAFLLLVSTKVTSTEEDFLTEHRHHRAKSPAHAPKKAPTYPPKVAPIYPPKKAPAYPPKISPVHSPSKHYHGDCVKLCIEYCQNGKSKRACERICVPCCDKYQCVPGRPEKKCVTWDKVWYHGDYVPCPTPKKY